MKLVAYLKTGPTATHAVGWQPPATYDLFRIRKEYAVRCGLLLRKALGEEVG
jgi:hypothetical protein